MTIRKTIDCWFSTEAEDIKTYLDAYSIDNYSLDEFRHANCSCGSLDFKLEADQIEGAAKKSCNKCSVTTFICDSEEYWEDAEPKEYKCSECNSKNLNIGVGFSLYEDRSAIRWLYLATRCIACGALGCFAEWKVGYSPSLQLIEKV